MLVSLSVAGNLRALLRNGAWLKWVLGIALGLAQMIYEMLHATDIAKLLDIAAKKFVVFCCFLFWTEFDKFTKSTFWAKPSICCFLIIIINMMSVDGQAIKVARQPDQGMTL